MPKNRKAAKNFTNRLGVEDAVDNSDIFDADATDVSSLHYPVQCSSLRKNGYALLQGDRMCKIVDMTTSKTGKHGHAKVHLVGIDVFSGKKVEDLCPSTHNMNVPNVAKIDYIVVDMGGDGFLSLLDDGGNLKTDIQVTDDDIRKDIRDKLDKRDDDNLSVSVLRAMDKELVMTVKVVK